MIYEGYFSKHSVSKECYSTLSSSADIHNVIANCYLG